MWSISTYVILISLTTISKLSFGKSCEERLDSLEGLLKELISRDEESFALDDLVKSVVETAVTQQIKARWQRLEDFGKSREESWKSTEDMLYDMEARLKRLEELSDSGIQNKQKLFEEQKTITEKLEARVTELERKTSRPQTVFKGEGENQNFAASHINLNNIPRTNMLVKGLRNPETDSKQFSSQNVLPKSDNHFGEKFANKTEETDSSWNKAHYGEKSMQTLVQKRDLSGIHPTNPPTHSPVPVHETAAFSAYISLYETHLTEDLTLKFDRVITNIGNHYNPYSGTFTAPQHGAYVFTWGLYCHTEGHIFSQLVVNSNSKGATYTSSEGARNIRLTTGMVVVEVNAGDVVFVRTHPTRPNGGSLYSGGDFRSTFSGWKLY